jgi:hypothetical protein
MRTVGLHATVVLAVLVTIGCCSGVHPETLSTTKATWEGKVGTAVTITQHDGTQELQGAKSVSFKFCEWRTDDEFWEVADFTVPVMKLEPKAVTLFFSADDSSGAMMLEHLPSEFRAGRTSILGCHPDGDC